MRTSLLFVSLLFLQDDDRIDRLIRQLGSPDFAEQGVAAKELESLGVKALPALLEAKKSKTAQVAEWASKLCDRIEPREKAAIDKLVDQLGNADFEVQGRAAKQLEELGDRAIPALKEAANSDRRDVKEWAARVLAKLDGVKPAATVAGRKVDEAVRAALVWLARHQQRDGSWSPRRFAGTCGKAKAFGEGRCDGAAIDDDHDVGVTSLALLALLGGGYGVHAQDEYDGVAVGEAVRRAVRHLVGRQLERGEIVRPGGEKYVYDHAIATAALAEAARTCDGAAVFPADDVKALKAAVEKAAAFLLQCQNKGAGWRYAMRGGDNDSHVTAWAVQGLLAARRAGVKIPDESLKSAATWFDDATDQNYGRVGYTMRGTGKVFVPGQNEEFKHTETLTAAGWLCRLQIDEKATKTAKVFAAVPALLGNDLPAWNKNAVDLCYWYYGTAFFARAGEMPKAWRTAAKDALEKNQILTAGRCDNGSWAQEDRWGQAAGRVYVVAMSALTLEVLHGLKKIE